MSVAHMVQSLQDFATEIEGDYLALPPDTDADLLVYLLSTLRDCRTDLLTTYKRIEQDLIQTSGNRRWVVEGLGEVEIKKVTKRTNWDNEGLTQKLVGFALDERIVDEQTGEYEPAWQAVARVLSECARPSWRVTPLRARHIDVDEFCTETDDGHQVSLPPRKQ